MGLKASTTALLKSGDDIEAQIEKAMKFEQVFKDLKSYTDPVGAAVDALSLEMKGLNKIFEEAGATSAEYAQLEDLRSIKLKEIIDDQTSSLRDVMDMLNGDGGGVSTFAQLTSDLAKLDTFKADIALGKQIDQSAFSSLADKIVGEGQSLYGNNSSEYQNLVNSLKDATNGAIGNVESAYNAAASAGDSTTQAITAQTNAITQNQQIQSDFLSQIAASLAAIQASAASSGKTSPWRVVNGKVVAA